MFSYLARGQLVRQLINRSIQARRHYTDPAAYFQYSRAIVGSVPNSFVHDSLRHNEPKDLISLERARQQLSGYIDNLKGLIPTVVQVPVDERYPDLVFVEDPAVVLENTALLTQMRPRSRAGEAKPMRPVLDELGFDIVEMKEPGAYLDGGDVLFTGREFLVGLSGRTNAVSGMDHCRGRTSVSLARIRGTPYISREFGIRARLWVAQYYGRPSDGSPERPMPKHYSIKNLNLIKCQSRSMPNVNEKSFNAANQWSMPSISVLVQNVQ